MLNFLPIGLRGLLCAGLLLPALAATAQVPTLTGLNPARNLRNAAATTDVAFTFSTTMSGGAATLGAVKVFSQQRGGRMQNGARGTTTQSTNTLTFNPTNDFKPGETVFSTVTTAAQSGGGQALARGRVQRFTVATGGTGRGDFVPGTNPAVGATARPRAVAVGDVDGDGDLDLLTANELGNSVSVRFNDGAGGFSGGSEVAVGSGTYDVALGDVDGDGDLDLLTANSNPDNVSVRLNNGAGGFSGGSDVAVGNAPRSLAVGDVDGDGDLDFLTGNAVDNNVSVRLNNGAGGFGGGSEVAVGAGPTDVTLADVDGDGDLDLLAGSYVFNVSSTVSVRLNNGAGAFSGGSDPAVGLAPAALAVGDVDGDGDLDLLTGNASANTVSVRLNNGAGGFGGGSEVAVGSGPESLALADVDSDGDLDFVTGNFFDNNASVRLNNGTGGFGGSGTVAVGGNPRGLALADVDGDGDVDLVTTNNVANTASVRLNAAAVTLATVTTAAPTTVTNSSAVLGGNVTNAGGGTVTERGVVYVVGTGTPTTANTKVINGSGTGSFSATRSGLAGSTQYTVRAYAINGAGTAYGSSQTFTTLNNPPVANDDSYTVNEGSGATALAVLNNDTGTSISITAVTQPANGSVTFTATGVSFTPTVGFSGTTSFTYTLTGNGGTDVATVTVTVLNVNDPPVLTTSGGNTAFTAGGGPVAIDIVLTASDTDNATLASATVSITGGLQTGQDRLAFTANAAYGNITGSYASATGILTLTSAGATASVARWQAALQSVTYNNLSNTPTGSTRTVSFRVNDGAANSNTPTKTIALTTPTPTLTTLSPSSGPIGASIILTGTNLSGATGVRFGSIAAGSYTVNSGTQVTAVVPSGASSGNVVVTTPFGTSNGLAFTVGAANTSTTLGSSANPSVYGQSVTFTATVTNTNGSASTVGTSTVSFYNGATLLTTRAVGTGGVATYVTTLLAVGSAPITASYGGSAGNFNASTSGVVTQVVGVAGSTATVSSSANPSASGQSVTFTATVAAQAPSTVRPTGTVTFKDGGTTLGTGTLNSSGLATYATAALATGTHPITVEYGGSANHTGSTSAALSQVVNAPAGPAITSFSPPSGPPGQSVTVTGTNLGGATSVTVNGVAGSITANTSTSLTFTLGANPPGTFAPIVVTTPGGTATSSGSFTVTAPLTILSYSPTRNQRTAPASTNVAFTFDRTMSGAAATLGSVKVFSQQRGGRMQNGAQGTTTVSGTVVTFNPTTDFRPGETVYSTVTTAATATVGATLPQGRVQQFTVATGGTGRGNFGGGSDPGVGSGPSGVTVGDVDGDGDLDVLTANYNGGTVSVRLNGGTATFASSPDVAVGSGPIDVAVGDVDGDGDLDLLAANFLGGTVSVRLNNGTGTFAGSANVAVGGGPIGVTLGDVDGDGDLDLLAANYNSNTVSVRLNGGDATGSNTGVFAGGTDPAVGNDPRSVALADVDGDGDLDLLAANETDNTVSVRLNDGTGTFAGGPDVAVGNGPVDVAVGDVDGDGDLDLLTANGTDNTVSVRLNNSTGTFAGSFDAGVGSVPRSLALADVDGDGDLDLLTANNDGNTVSVRLNGGTGTFAGGSDVAVGNQPFGLALGDVDGDGDVDFVAANQDDNTVSVRLNLPPPTISSFAPASGPVGTSVTVTGTNLAGATGVTVNGTAGTITANTATSLTFTVGTGSSTGLIVVATAGGTASSSTSFTVVPLLTLTAVMPAHNLPDAPASTNVALAFDQPLSGAAATLGAVKVFSAQRGGRMQNGARGATTVSGNTLTFDPTTDFKPGETIFTTVTTAVRGSGGAVLAAGEVQQFTVATGGTGRGSFGGGSNPGVGNGPFSVALGDVDGDGDLDLLTANYDDNTVSVRLNDGTGNFTAPATNPNPAVGTGPASVALGDVDGDGDLDLLAANVNANAAGTVSVRLNDGTGNFTAPATNAEPTVGSQPTSVALGDVDGDGDLDLLAANDNANTVSVRLNDGTGNFTAPATNAEPAVGTTPYSMALGDVDGDGDLDLLTANFNANTVSVRLNDGSGTFTAPATNAEPAVGIRPASVAVGDVDGDGDLDLLTANYDANTVSVRLNDGTGNFTAPATNAEPAVGTTPLSVALGDVDGDGDLDLLTANFNANSVSVRLNDGSGTFSGGSDPTVGSAPRSVALGDVDNDGDLDLLAANNNANTVSVRLNQPPAPIITSFTPASGPVGTSVTVTGTGLAGATAVTVNGTAGSITANTATSLTFTVGAGSSTGVIAITTPGGTATSSTSFTVTAALQLTGLSPARNLRNAAVNTNTAFTFDQTMSSAAATLGAVKVFSSQRGGRMQNGAGGSTTRSGNTLTFNPTNDFKPGETVYTTVTTAAAGSSGAVLARGQVQQFTVAAGGTGRGNFQPGSNPGVGSSPLGTALGDVDGDGDLDMLTINLAVGAVSVRLNGGDATGSNTGTFSNGSTVGVGNRPSRVVLADVDGDGDLDLLVVNRNPGQVNVRLNGSDGSGSNTGLFSNGSDPAVGTSPGDLAVADVDGDGDLDFVTTHDDDPGTVSVRLNGGDDSGSNTGTFSNGSTVAVGNRPQAVALGDVDGDGDLDLLTANYIGGTVSVRLNGGDATGSNPGTFSNGSDVAVGSDLQGLALGDVDGDGDLDLATASYTANTMGLRLNNGLGTFSGSTAVAVGTNPASAVLADVDGDGDLDLLAENYGSGTVSVRLNGGDATGSNTGTFSNGSDPAVGTGPIGVTPGDVDGDGDLDFAVANFNDGTVSVRLNQPPVPTLVAVGPAAELPGQAVTLTGTGFAAGSSVTFGGVAAASVSFTSPTSLTAVVPVGAAPGSSAVVVSTASGSSPGSPAFEVLQVYRDINPSGCLTTDPLVLTGSGGAGAWRYLRLPGAGGAVIAAVEDTRNLGSVTAGFTALGTGTSAAVRQDGGGRRYLDRNFYLTAANPTFTGQTVRVRLFGLSSELTRLTAADANATLATLNASQYDGTNVNCDLSDNDPTGQRRLLPAPATELNGADWFTAQLTVADHFSEFYLTGANSPLPVELLTFTATAEGNAVALAWRTASEKNSARFEVERSADGREFAPIGSVAAQGSKASPTTYAYRDAKPTNAPTHQSTIYYRLRQVDTDGTFSYSPVRAVQLTSSPAHQLTAFPNPARTAVTVGDLSAGATVEVLDALGRTVARATADATGTARLALPAGLAAGVYVVKSSGQALRLAVE